MKLIVLYFLIFSIVSCLAFYVIYGVYDPRILVASIPATLLFFYGIKKVKIKGNTLP